MWNHQDNNNSSLSPEKSTSSPPITYEDCPNCHSRVQAGRFCASCGQRLKTQNNTFSSLMNQDSPIDNYTIGNDDFWVGSQGPSLRSLHEMNQSSNSLLPPYTHTFSSRRFSSDFADGDLLIGSTPNGDTLHSGVSISSSNLLSHPSTSFPSRRRAMTSNTLGLTSGLDGDDPLFGDYLDTDPYERSQEPLFRNNRTGSVSLDPLENFGALHSMRSSVDAPLHSTSNSNNLLPVSLLSYETSQQGPSGLDYVGDTLDDLSLGHFQVGRSFSDVNSSTLDNYDFNTNSLFKNYSTSTNQSTTTTTANHTISSNPLLLKRNSASGLSFAPHDDLFSLHDTMDSQVVKGSVNFPSRSIRSMNPTNSISPKLEGQVSAGQSLSPTSQASQQDPNSPLQKPVFTDFDSMLPSKAVPRQNSISMLSSYKGKLLEISERKKLNEFNTFYNRVVELVCTQNGSKNLQTYLNSSMSDTVREIVIDSIIQEIEPTGCKIICDTFGNYFYQLLFKKASSSQKEQLLHRMLFPRGDDEGSTIYEISINKTGTFAFQNIIDYMADHDELGRLVMKALQKSIFNGTTENVILQLIKENKGTHIIQRIMKTFSMELWEPIYSILLTNCYMIAMDRNGSMVLRLCYDLVTLSKKQAIAQDIISHSLELAVDPVGNYVVQHILSIPENVNEEEEKVYEGFITAILKQLSGHYVELSKQKYSSNVVEKSIVNSTEMKDHSIYDEILDSNAIVQLLENHFGTYVLQKTLQSLTSDELKRVDTTFRSSRLVNSNHGVNLLNKWRQIVNKATKDYYHDSV